MSPGPPFAFNALKLLVGCQEEHLAYENCVMRFDVVIFLEQGAGCLHVDHLMPLPSQNPWKRGR